MQPCTANIRMQPCTAIQFQSLCPRYKHQYEMICEHWYLQTHFCNIAKKEVNKLPCTNFFKSFKALSFPYFRDSQTLMHMRINLGSSKKILISGTHSIPIKFGTGSQAPQYFFFFFKDSQMIPICSKVWKSSRSLESIALRFLPV